MIKQGYAYQIDTLRFVAMLLIFCNHCTFLKDNEDTATFFENYFHYGGIGVEFFILLSGFLAAYTYKVGCKTFVYVKKRFFRLFPVHWVCLILFLPVLFADGQLLKNVVKFFMTATLTQSLTPYTWSTFNGASWTISTLWIMYLLTPTMMKYIQKIGSLNLSMLLSLFIVGGFVINHLYYDYNEISLWFFYISPFYRIITFLSGMFLAELIKRHRNLYDERSYKFKSILEIVAIFLLVAELLCISKYSHYGYNYSLLMLCIIGIFFMGGGVLSKKLSNGLLVKISKISFSFYLVHYWVLTLFTGFCIKHFDIQPTILNYSVIFAVDLAITFIMAYFIYYFVEKRLTSYLLDKYGK